MEKVKLDLIQIEKNYRDSISLFVRNRTLFIVGRLDKNTKKIFFVNDFFPRFYIEKEENLDFVLEQKKDIIRCVMTKEDGKEFNYRNLKGDKELICIFTYTTSQVPELRDYFTKTYEANIKFTTVFRREKLIKEFFYVPKWLLEQETRFYKIRGIDYIMTKEKEITGGKLSFD